MFDERVNIDGMNSFLSTAVKPSTSVFPFVYRRRGAVVKGVEHISTIVLVNI